VIPFPKVPSERQRIEASSTMSDTISPVHQLERISDYRRFYHTKSYISCKSKAYKNEMRLMEVCRHRNLNKFCIHQKKWNDLQQPVPVRYLREISVDFDTLPFTVELDGEEYEKALSLPFFPKQGIIRVGAAAFSAFNFLEGTSEQEAIDLLKELSAKKHVFCLIKDCLCPTRWIQLHRIL